MRKWFKEALYWLKVHIVPSRRYHIINLKKAGKYHYKYGYVDPVHKLFLASFIILCDFVEQEMDQINWDSDPDHQRAAVEIKALYNWFKFGRKASEDELSAIYEAIPGIQKEITFMPSENYPGEEVMVRRTGPAYEAWSQAYHEFEKQDQVMLKRLIEVRPYLWT